MCLTLLPLSLSNKLLLEIGNPLERLLLRLINTSQQPDVSSHVVSFQWRKAKGILNQWSLTECENRSELRVRFNSEPYQTYSGRQLVSRAIQTQLGKIGQSINLSVQPSLEILDSCDLVPDKTTLGMFKAAITQTNKRVESFDNLQMEHLGVFSNVSKSNKSCLILFPNVPNLSKMFNTWRQNSDCNCQCFFMLLSKNATL